MQDTHGQGPASRREICIAALVAVVVFLIVAWPWVRDAATSIPDGSRADDLAGGVDARLVIWILSWDVHALLTQPLHLFDANIVYPARGMLAGSEHLLGSLPSFAPVYLVSGNPVVATNLATMATYVLAALGMYVLLRSMGLPRVSGAVGAMAFAIGPMRVPAEIHVLQYSNYCFPLLLLAVRHSTARAGLVFVTGATMLAIFSSYYIAQMAAVLLAVELVMIAVTVGLRSASKVACAVLVAFGVLAIVSMPYLHFPRYARSEGFELNGLFSVARALAGTSLRRALDPGDRQLGMGWAVAGLAVLGLIQPVLRRAAPTVRWWRWIALAVAGGALGCGGLAFTSLAVGLPQLVMIGRVAHRFYVLAHLGVVGLAAEGTALLAEAARGISGRGKVLPLLLGTGLVAVVAFPRALALTSLPRTTLPTGGAVPSVYRWLARSADGPLLDVPGPVLNLNNLLLQVDTMYLSTFHWLPLLNGHTGYWPWWSTGVLDEIARLPDPDALQVVVDLTGLRWILVRRSRVKAEDFARWQTLPSRVRGVVALPQGAPDLLLRVDVPQRRRWAQALAAGCCEPGRTALGTPLDALPEGTARGRVSATGVPETSQVGRSIPIKVTVENTGTSDWPVLVPPGSAETYLVAVTATWELDGDALHARSELMRLPRDVAAGDRATVSARLKAPDLAGSYTLTLALTQVRGTSFADTPPLRAPMTVVPALP